MKNQSFKKIEEKKTKKIIKLENKILKDICKYKVV